MKYRGAHLLLLFIVVFCSHAVTQQTSETGGARTIRYLRPLDFKGVPARVRSKLVEGQCLIPQDSDNAVAHNVVSGEFARQGQQDWAAYCSVRGKSKVMVIWGGPSQCSGSPFDAGPVNDATVSRDLDDAAGNMPHGSFWTLAAIPHAELLVRLKSMKANEELLKSATRDALERSSIAGGNVVDCHNGHWRELWYGD